MNKNPEQEKEPLPLLEEELLVRRSDEDLARFDAQRITEALVRETKLSVEQAHAISLEVKEQIERSGIRTLTAPLIRALVEAKLFEYGLASAYRLHARLGVPLYDVDRMIQSAPRAGEALHGPEGTSLALAEAIKREYAMLNVFSETVAHAHLAGDLHIENLGEIDRPTTMIGSVDLIKRYGVRLPGGFGGARPARRPEVLAAHLVKYTAALHGYFSDAPAWDAVNFAMAPLLVGLNSRELRQVAQVLLFELSAPAAARGGQLVLCDIHLDWDAPAYLSKLPAVGAGGEKQTTTYGELNAVAREFLQAFFEVYLEGDGRGLPFTGLRPIVHLTPAALAETSGRGFRALLTRALVERGNVVAAFERATGDAEVDAAAAFTARYGVGGDKLKRAGDSSQWRSAVFSAVAINLPRLGHLAEGDQLKVFELLTNLLELAAKASLEKRVFLEKLLARGEAGALALLAMRLEREQFLSLGWTLHVICPVGLAELTRIVTGAPLDADRAAQEFAARIAAHFYTEIERLSAKHKVRFVPAESHDLAAPHRFAQLDGRYFGATAVNPLCSPPDEWLPDELFYTNSFRLPVQSTAYAIERLRLEGAQSGGRLWRGMSDLWLMDAAPSDAQVADLLAAAFQQTGVNALTCSPEFTLCPACHTAARGRLTACPQCGSTRVDGLAQTGNRYSQTATWPRWKLAELKLRRRAEL